METTLQPSRAIPFYRLAGASFMLGNVLFFLNKIDEMSRLFLSRWMPDVISGQNPLLILIGQVALIIGYVGFFQYYAPRLGRSGKNALRLFCSGGIILAVGHVGFMSALGEALPASLRPYAEGFFVFILIGLLLLLAGLIWLGVLNLRRPVLSRWRWLPLATGLMGFIGFFLFSVETITATFLFFRTLFALGLIGLGLVLFLEKPQLQWSVTHSSLSERHLNSWRIDRSGVDGNSCNEKAGSGLRNGFIGGYMRPLHDAPPSDETIRKTSMFVTGFQEAAFFLGGFFLIRISCSISCTSCWQVSGSDTRDIHPATIVIPGRFHQRLLHGRAKSFQPMHGLLQFGFAQYHQGCK